MLVNSSHINPEKWNALVNANPNNKVYFYFDYLNTVCENWEALIVGDYNLAFPLPYKIKRGIKYYYAPFWIQRLEWLQLSNNFVSEQAKTSLLKILSAPVWSHVLLGKDVLIDVNANKELKNFILTKQSGKWIYKLNENAKRNCLKAVKSPYHLFAEINVENFITFFKLNAPNVILSLPEKAQTILLNVITTMAKHGHARCYAIKNEKQEISAAGVFLEKGNRMVFLKGATSEEGKKHGSSFLLQQKMLELSETLSVEIYDFCGGSVSGTQQFYQSFGGQPEYYFEYKFSRIPFLKKFLKK